jgi:hypothetical protein
MVAQAAGKVARPSQQAQSDPHNAFGDRIAVQKSRILRQIFSQQFERFSLCRN